MRLKALLEILTPLTQVRVLEYQPNTGRWNDIINGYKCDIIHEYNNRIYYVTTDDEGVMLIRVFKER